MWFVLPVELLEQPGVECVPGSCMIVALLCTFSCRLAAGTTRFCAGIVSTARPMSVELKMAHYSNRLYQQLEQETGVQTGTESVIME